MLTLCDHIEAERRKAIVLQSKAAVPSIGFYTCISINTAFIRLFYVDLKPSTSPFLLSGLLLSSWVLLTCSKVAGKEGIVRPSFPARGRLPCPLIFWSLFLSSWLLMHWSLPTPRDGSSECIIFLTPFKWPCPFTLRDNCSAGPFPQRLLKSKANFRKLFLAESVIG